MDPLGSFNKKTRLFFGILNLLGVYITESFTLQIQCRHSSGAVQGLKPQQFFLFKPTGQTDPRHPVIPVEFGCFRYVKVLGGSSQLVSG